MSVIKISTPLSFTFSKASRPLVAETTSAAEPNCPKARANVAAVEGWSSTIKIRTWSVVGEDSFFVMATIFS